jgi:coenzyme F420-reducing hydrogenase alpha subunit
VTNEYQVAHSTAKHTQHGRPSYAVGALARFNLSHRQLHPRAQEAAAALGLVPGCSNPYMNTVAQVVEMVHFLEEAISLCELLIDRGLTLEPLVPPAYLTGEGTGSCEAPRGTLFHHYAFRDGKAIAGDCVIPTGQNLANIEADMRALVPTLLGRPTEQIAHNLEMLVRAYDPCISCSTHMLEVEFV